MLSVVLVVSTYIDSTALVRIINTCGIGTSYFMESHMSRVFSSPILCHFLGRMFYALSSSKVLSYFFRHLKIGSLKTKLFSIPLMNFLFMLFRCLFSGLEEQCEDDEYELDGVVYSVDLKLCGEVPVNFPANTSGHLQSRLVIYSSAETLEDTKAYLEKTLLSNLAEDNVPFAEPPVVIVFNAGHIDNLDEREILSNEGQSLADSLGCGFVDVSGSDGQPRYESNIFKGTITPIFVKLMKL